MRGIRERDSGETLWIGRKKVNLTPKWVGGLLKDMFTHRSALVAGFLGLAYQATYNIVYYYSIFISFTTYPNTELTVQHHNTSLNRLPKCPQNRCTQNRQRHHPEIRQVPKRRINRHKNRHQRINRKEAADNNQTHTRQRYPIQLSMV